MNELKQVLVDFGEKVYSLAKEDAEKWAGPMAEDLQVFLRRRYVDGDKNAEKDLKLLEAQAQLLALKHIHRVDNMMADAISDGVGILARLGFLAMKGV